MTKTTYLNKRLMMGNEAVARGAIEAGVNVVTSYPGTPASEILPFVLKLSKAENLDVYGEWSVNEKVAFEVAIGAAYCGANVLFASKHLGMNLISDPLNTVNLTGVDGALVLVIGEDPNPNASQNAQDSRYFAQLSKIPCFLPSNVPEAKDFVKKAFKLSHAFQIPVMVSLSPQICHSYHEVKLETITKNDRNVFFADTSKRKKVCLPSNSQQFHKELVKKIENIQKSFEGYVSFEAGEPDVLYVTSGVTYTYLKEAMRILDLNLSVLKISTIPVPDQSVSRIISEFKHVVVLEELEPIIEREIYRITNSRKISIIGKFTKDIPPYGELSTDFIANLIKKMRGEEGIFSQEPNILKRIPYLCAGCPHRSSYIALKRAIKTFEKSSKKKCVVIGDRGCYNIGSHPPLRVLDTLLCMGASAGIAQGISKCGNNSKVVAVMGDSTFYHAGISGLINAMYNNSNITVLILDNSWTAMTGHQPNPGTGTNALGGTTDKLNIFRMVKRGLGVEFVRLCDPYDLKEAEMDILDALRYENGLSVVILKRACVLKAPRDTLNPPLSIDPNKCTFCQKCLIETGCPALVPRENYMEINSELSVEKCVGCGTCKYICPFDAFVEVVR